MKLTWRDELMLKGAEGPAVKAAMELLTRVGEVYGAEELVDVTKAHIGGVSYGTAGQAGIEWAQKFLKLGARVRLPTTLNIDGRDEVRWKQFGIPEDFAEKCAIQEKAHLEMGCIPNWTCAPYQVGIPPRFGEFIAWSESNAIVYANSVLGARTPRYGDFVPLCAAITGRAPLFSLYLDEARKPQIHLAFKEIDEFHHGADVLAAAAGHLIGGIAGEKVPVLTGLPQTFTADELKILGAGTAVGGAVALFHAVGMTPEAPTFEAACKGAKPERYDIGLDDLKKAVQTLSTTTEGPVDLVALGCPHFSYQEMKRLAVAFGGRRVAPGTKVWVHTNRVTNQWAEETGVAKALRDSGVEVTTDSCFLSWPIESWGFKSMMTNSGKFAFYSKSKFQDVLIGSLENCAHAAVLGYVGRGSCA